MQDNHIISLPITTVPGVSDQHIHGICLISFQPQYLIVAKEVAKNFAIVSVHFGKNLQLPHGTGEVLASLFAGDLESYKLNHHNETLSFLEQTNLDVPLPLKFNTCLAGDVIRVRVRNITRYSLNFSCAFYGPAIE